MTGKLVLPRLSLVGNLEKSPTGGSVAVDSVMKSNTVTLFTIISGLRNILQNHRRVPECRKKQFEEGYWKDFHN
jgi:hypothetical protein